MGAVPCKKADQALIVGRAAGAYTCTGQDKIGQIGKQRDKTQIGRQVGRWIDTQINR